MLMGEAIPSPSIPISNCQQVTIRTGRREAEALEGLE